MGSIGRISEVRSDNRRLEIINTLPDNYPKIAINKEGIFEALGMGNNRSFERRRTHWAVKDVDLFETTTRLLHEAGNVPVVLPEEAMKRVWGDRYKNKAKLVFLSHRASCRRQVSEVRELLENQGLRCFVAHQDVTPSAIWHNEILNALNTMDIFIGFVTDDFSQRRVARPGSWLRLSTKRAPGVREVGRRGPQRYGGERTGPQNGLGVRRRRNNHIPETRGSPLTRMPVPSANSLGRRLWADHGTADYRPAGSGNSSRQATNDGLR